MAFITRIIFRFTIAILKLLGKILSFLTSRIFLVTFLILLQMGIMVALPVLFSNYYKPVYFLLRASGYVAVFWLMSKDENPQFRLSWICLIFLFPLAGGAIYFLLANRRMPDKLERYMTDHLEDIPHYFIASEPAQAEPAFVDNQHQSKYVKNLSSYPTWVNTKVTYFPSGEDMFLEMVNQLKSAKHYIFLEFFILRSGKMMDTLLNILEIKLSQGVQVYFMYDDMGTILTLPPRFFKPYKEMGMNVCAFNPFRPHISPILNYRDHRKILVIDGIVAFCGGINIADEYINEEVRFGYWKDTGVMLEGSATWSFAVMFLQQWHFGTGSKIDTESFAPKDVPTYPDSGYTQAFGDCPLEPYNVAENVYLTAIRQAKNYIYITTPYVVIDNAMENSLVAAAQSGVDVRIITPSKYDKWYVHLLTRSHYSKLIEGGVKIYEYTPGFIHSKTFVADDKIAMVGTVNMDFRSFYLHFECSVLLYENPAMEYIKQDIIECIEASKFITKEEANGTSIPIRLAQSFLKLLAPLM